MNTISCSSCDAVFPVTTIPLNKQCPRCDAPLAGPRTPRFSFVSTTITPVELLHPAYCSVCGCFLSMIERIAVPLPACRFPMCQHKRAVAAAVELQKKTVDELARQQAEDLDRVENKLQELGHDPAAHDIAILPAFDRPLQTTSAVRKNALADRLSEIAAEARLEPVDEATTSYTLYAPPPEMAYVAQACATCRGHCCRHGGDNAYLSRQTLLRVLESSPKKNIEDLLREYLDLVPEQSYEDSCIYHAEGGCRLPASMRSDTCNDFFCSGTRSISSIMRGEEGSPVLAAALTGEKIVRLAVINGKEINIMFGK